MERAVFDLEVKSIPRIFEVKHGKAKFTEENTELAIERLHPEEDDDKRSMIAVSVLYAVNFVFPCFAFMASGNLSHQIA